MEDLILDSRNPRQHPQSQVNQIADSIREFGFVMPVVIDDSGHVVIGRGRVLAAKKLRMPRIPVVQIRHLSVLFSASSDISTASSQHEVYVLPY